MTSVHVKAGARLASPDGLAKILVAESEPDDAVLGVSVRSSGPSPRDLGIDRAGLVSAGFEGRVGEAMLVPRSADPLVAVGIGDPAHLDAAGIRNAAAAFARAAGKQVRLATSLANFDGVAPELAAQAVVEGVLLARYSYRELKHKPGSPPIEELTLLADPKRMEGIRAGSQRGLTFAQAALLCRDLANAPPAYLTASRMAEAAVELGANKGLDVEVFDKDALIEMGCGGLLGVNAGSAEPPRLVKLTFKPRRHNGGRSQARGHLALVGKGVMYDSGGISLKPSDAVHATMKQDMSGAAAILAAMSALKELNCEAAVTGYLMCTDNMPSGSATKLGDVLTIRGGKTVEVLNTDAEGRLILADGLVLAGEEKPDAIIDIATLTGACLRALGSDMAGMFGNNEALQKQISNAAHNVDEPVWLLPLYRRYRRELDSDVADLKNMGGPNGGAIHAALFLEEFVGSIPWAHLDIAGPVLGETDESWRPKGATGFGTRLLLDVALNFTPPAA